MLGKLARKDESDAAEKIRNEKSSKFRRRLTRFEFHERRWWTSCYMRRALMPQWQRAQRYLKATLDRLMPQGIKISLPFTNEFRMDMARLEIPVSG